MEGLQRLNKVSYIFMLVITFISCKSVKVEHTAYKSDFMHFNDSIIVSTIVYDTIESIFLYENLIQPYIFGDAIAKDKGFIMYDSNMTYTYLKGYYYTNATYKTVFFDKNRTFSEKISDTTVSKFIANREIEEYVDELDLKRINPFCDCYYKKYKMKVEIITLGLRRQIVPLPYTCKELYYYKGNRYETMPLPTYLITHIFSWSEIH